jgi:hypothetical protein
MGVWLETARCETMSHVTNFRQAKPELFLVRSDVALPAPVKKSLKALIMYFACAFIGVFVAHNEYVIGNRTDPLQTFNDLMQQTL